MIERLQQALEHIDELPPEAQEDIAQQIEELASTDGQVPESDGDADEHALPERIRRALAAIGSASDLQYDDEFAALDRIRHESSPTPPIDLGDL